jgi:hypothetical protein
MLVFPIVAPVLVVLDHSICARISFSILQKWQIMKPTHSTMDHLTKTIRIMKKNNSTDTYEVVGQKLTCCSTELFIFLMKKSTLSVFPFFSFYIFDVCSFLISQC